MVLNKNNLEPENVMPIFEYRCRQCGRDFEALLKRREETVNSPACHSEELERKFSAFAVAANTPSGCAAAENCPSAHQCGGNCGCHQH